MRGYLVLSDDLKNKYFDICFESYWKNNLDISNKEVIEQILDFIKLDTKKFYEDIENEKVKNKLKELTNQAFEKDIFGAPTFVVNDKIFWGQDRLDYALEEYNS